MLYIIHETCRTEPNGIQKITYMSRFCWLGKNLALRRFSELFYIENIGVEFVSGIAECAAGIVLTYGVNDCEAKVAIISRDTVNKYLSWGSIKD